MISLFSSVFFFFFFNDTATTEIYTLSLHDALPIAVELGAVVVGLGRAHRRLRGVHRGEARLDLGETLLEVLPGHLGAVLGGAERGVGLLDEASRGVVGE